MSWSGKPEAASSQGPSRVNQGVECIIYQLDKSTLLDKSTAYIPPGNEKQGQTAFFAEAFGCFLSFPEKCGLTPIFPALNSWIDAWLTGAS